MTHEEWINQLKKKNDKCNFGITTYHWNFIRSKIMYIFVIDSDVDYMEMVLELMVRK